MIELIKNPNLNFMDMRKYGYLFSAVVIIASLILTLTVKPKLGVDFSGGALIWVKFEKPVEISQVRTSLSMIGQAQASIQRLAGTNEFVIRSVEKQDPDKFSTSVLKQLNRDFVGNEPELRSKETVEPKISQELTRNTILAVILALILMGIYVWIRFDFRFGVCSALSLIHTIIITIGALVLTGREFTIPIIGALLTILGYSINDTIVISDRVRENRKKLRGIPFTELVNTSLNESFSRTMLTGSSVIFTLLCLFFLGGPVIADFAFALLVGFIFGTYATTFVVCALVVDWNERFPKKGKK